jgi:polysaccharide export outer membrane protein
MKAVRVSSLGVAAALAAIVLIGCAGGNRVFSVKDGNVESGTLVLDSIPRQPEVDEYVIGYGDKLDVTFLYNESLDQKEIKVRPDGKISLPYVGEVRASGVRVSHLDSLLTAKYSEIIVNPNVTVIVRDFASQVVYVLGEVGNGGGYPYNRGLTLLGLLAQGRGLTGKGKENGVLVIRRIAPDHVVGIQVDFKELVQGKRFDLDIPLEPNDIVYVPKSKIARAADFADTLTKILMNPMDLYIKGWQVSNEKILYDFYRRTANTL